MSKTINKLKNQAKELSSNIKKRQPEVDQATANLDQCTKAYQTDSKRLRVLDGLLHDKTINHDESLERLRLWRTTGEAESAMHAAVRRHEPLSRLQNEEGRELSKLENLIYSEKLMKESKVESKKQETNLTKKGKVLVAIRDKLTKAETYLVELKEAQVENLRATVEKEVEENVLSSDIGKQNRKLHDDIEIQEARIPALKTAVEAEQQSYNEAKQLCEDAKSAYYTYRAYLAEIKYEDALASLIPVAAEYIAAKRVSGTGGYKNDLTIVMEKNEIETAYETIREELSVA